MGLIFAFVVGYAAGAKAGDEGYQEVVDALRAVGQSEEFRGLLAALRAHAGSALQELGGLLSEQPDEPVLLDRVRERVNVLMARSGVTSPAS